MPYEPAQYLNVDLELQSASSLVPLVEHLGKRVFVLHQAKSGRTQVVSLELYSQKPRDPEAALRAFAKLLHRLPPAPARAWKAARRCFNVGIAAGLEGAPFEATVTPRTVAAVSALGASLTITVYRPCEQAVSPPPAARSGGTSNPRRGNTD